MLLTPVIIVLIIAFWLIYTERIQPGHAYAAVGALSLILIVTVAGYRIFRPLARHDWNEATTVSAHFDHLLESSGTDIQSLAGGLLRVLTEFTLLAAASLILKNSGYPQYSVVWLCEHAVVRANRWHAPPGVALTVTLLLVAFVAGAVMHAVAAIILMVSLARVICRIAEIPALPLSSGMLASIAIGGYAVGSSDAANSVERGFWQLTLADYWHHSLPNLGALGVVIAVTLLMSPRVVRRVSQLHYQKIVEELRLNRAGVRLDVRHFLTGLLTLGVIVIAVRLTGNRCWPGLVVAFLLLATGCRKGHLQEALAHLGLDPVLALVGGFALTCALKHPEFGAIELLSRCVKYLDLGFAGTLGVAFLGASLTESTTWMLMMVQACSGASMGPEAVHAVGAGILAASVAMLPVSAAGIVLVDQTRSESPEDRITFRKHLRYGIATGVAVAAWYLLTSFF